MPRLSVTMIVRNEAHCLARCLDSIRAVADEVVVCDTGSTDGTPDLARALGARVETAPWHSDFAEARNRAQAFCTGDWLLHLDADEVVDPAGAARIRELVDADGAGADAIEVTLANYCDDMRAWRWVPVAPGDPMARGHAGYIAVGLLRLFRNGMGFEYREPVHENITESVRERAGVVRAEPILIHHYGYSPSPEKARAKAELYLEIALRKVQERPNDTKAWYDLAEQALGCGDGDTAEEACRRALELEPLAIGPATTLANILLNRGDFDEARNLLDSLERAGISPPHVVTALGAIACRQGRLDEAAQRFEAVLAASPHTLQARLYLARTLDRLGRTADARMQLEAALKTAPGLDELRNRLQAHNLRMEAEEAFSIGNTTAALKTLAEALRLDPDDPLIHNDLGVVLSALGEPEKARRAFERALRLAPQMTEASENLDALAE